VIAWSWVLFFEVLHVVHEGFTFGVSGGAAWSCAFVFQMRFVLSWSGEFREFLCDQISDFLATGEPSFFRCVFFDKGGFVVEGRSWSVLALIELCFAKLASDYAARVGDVCEVGGCGGLVEVGSRRFFCLSEIFSFGRAYDDSVSAVESAFGFVVGGCWFVGVVIEDDLFGGFTFISETESWSFIE